ncbi:MAG: hypothetical protein CTY18_06030 [Methylomonas sp.]|nr:MAG: hypothetical protein CTY24_11820 [Methylobacter sp.]PPD36032.1 MAG: hypothetical protein CTY18_06030 [Methylomonas sp.]
MAAHIAPVVLHVRIYDGNININRPLHEMTEPYRYHLLVLINDKGVARLEGLDGSIEIKDRRELIRLKNYGVCRVEWRHGENEYAIDLE